MKKKIVSNFWLKIMAVLVSFLIWLMVINGDDPIKTETFRNVPITIKNADVFMEKVKKSLPGAGGQSDRAGNGFGHRICKSEAFYPGKAFLRQFYGYGRF